MREIMRQRIRSYVDIDYGVAFNYLEGMKIVEMPSQRLWGAVARDGSVALGVALIAGGRQSEVRERIERWLSEVHRLRINGEKCEEQRGRLGMYSEQWSVFTDSGVMRVVFLTTEERTEDGKLWLMRFLIYRADLPKHSPAVAQAHALLFTVTFGASDFGLGVPMRHVVSPDDKWEISVPRNWNCNPIGEHGDGVLAHSRRVILMVDPIVGGENESVSDYISEELDFVRSSTVILEKPVIESSGDRAELRVVSEYGGEPYVSYIQIEPKAHERIPPGLKIFLRVRVMFPLRITRDFMPIFGRILSSWRPRRFWLSEIIRLRETSEDFRELEKEYQRVIERLTRKRIE